VEFACYLFSVGYMMLMEVLGGRQLGLMDLGDGLTTTPRDVEGLSAILFG
jgi:hypothetical protein